MPRHGSESEVSRERARPSKFANPNLTLWAADSVDLNSGVTLIHAWLVNGLHLSIIRQVAPFLSSCFPNSKIPGFHNDI